MSQTAPASPARGLSTLAEAAAAARSLAQGIPSTSTGTSRTVPLNPPNTTENISHSGAHRRLELEDRLEEEDEEEVEEEEQADESLIKALRRMGIRAPKQFDPKRDKNFESWLERTEFHLVVNKCPEEDKTSSLLLLLDVNSFEAARHLNIKSDTPYAEAKQKLKDYYAVTETKEELREKLNMRVQEPGETIESFSRDIKLIGHKAYPNSDPQLLESMMMQVFVNGLRDPTSRERVILYSPKTLTEAAKYARFSETAVRVAHRTPQTATTSVNAMNPTNSYRHQPKPQAGNHQSRGSERGTARNRYNSFQSQNAQHDKRAKPFQKYNNRAGSVNSSQNNRCCFNCGKPGHLAKGLPVRETPAASPSSVLQLQEIRT